MKILARFISVIALAAVAAVQHAGAQPCAGPGPLNVFNNTPCNVTLNLVSVPPIPAIALPPFAGGAFPIPAGTNFLGVTSAGGAFYPFGPSPIVAWPQWVPNWFILAPGGCCVDLLYNPATCNMQIAPSAGPPPCRP